MAEGAVGRRDYLAGSAQADWLGGEGLGLQRRLVRLQT
jgi:hypothetical protein